MKFKILMVCLGNICRSPLAEGILASKLPSDKFQVDSAGTGDYHIGGAPDPRSIAVAKKNGIDISCQKARQFTTEDFAIFDKIYVMDQSNYNNVLALAPDEASKNKVDLILNELFPDENVDVQDPYFGIKDGFENVYKLLDEVCTIIADDLKLQHVQ
jgi:protein-tyrosine phosphatase